MGERDNRPAPSKTQRLPVCFLNNEHGWDVGVLIPNVHDSQRLGLLRTLLTAAAAAPLVTPVTANLLAIGSPPDPFSSRDGQIRTGDLLLPKQAR